MIPLARYAITAGAAGLVGFAAASYLRPESHTEYYADEAVKYKDVTTSKTLYVLKARSWASRVIEEKKPDGTEITTHETEGTETEVAARREQKAEADGSGSGKASVVELADQASRGRWSVTALVGTSLHGQRTFGAGASYRLVGPITVGAWGLSSGHFGGSLGVQW